MNKIDRIIILGKEMDLYIENEINYFSAQEVGDILEYSKANISKMVSKVDEDEKKQFCVHTNSTSTKARNQNQWFLTKDGLYELLFQSRKPIAKEFKKEVKRILKEIEQNKYYIATEKDDNWIGIRQDSKVVRKEETDTIKEFVELAKQQGSINPEWYYKHFSNLVINKLNIDKGLKRNELSDMELNKIIILEENIKYNIKLYMDNGYYYKDIYKIIKRTINNI